MNYFDFFELEEKFGLDQKALKKKYLAISRKYHPDFYTQEKDEQMEEALRLSSIANEAFNTLADEQKRIKYILVLHGVLEPEGHNTVPQDFLMEVMEINEAIMDLQMEYEANSLEKITKDIHGLKKSLHDGVRVDMDKFDSGDKTPQVLEGIKTFYLKYRYLDRMDDNLRKLDGSSGDENLQDLL